jgi:hypothetical protein
MVRVEQHAAQALGERGGRLRLGAVLAWAHGWLTAQACECRKGAHAAGGAWECERAQPGAARAALERALARALRRREAGCAGAGVQHGVGGATA